MEALADADEDEWLDDGAVEIGSDEEYNGWYVLQSIVLLPSIVLSWLLQNREKSNINILIKA